MAGLAVFGRKQGDDIAIRTALHSLFDRLATADSLSLGLDRVMRRSPMSGADRETPRAFQASGRNRLDMLAAAIKTNGHQPGAVRRFSIARKSGGHRTIGLLNVTDRVVQSAAVVLMQPILEQMFEENSFGYRIGRSVDAAARRISVLRGQGFTHVVEADVKRFFDTVPHDPLLVHLSALGFENRMLALIQRWLDQSGTPGLGLVQGAPVSPLLANLYLDHVDEVVAARGAHIVRYADDFVILTRTRQAAEEERDAIIGTLAGMGLELHPEKTRVTDFDRGFDFLGRRFLKSLVLDAPDEADDPDEAEWEQALADAVPDDAPAEMAPTAARMTRGMDFGATIELPSRPFPQADDAVAAALSPRVRTLHLFGKGRVLDARDMAVVVRQGDQEIWLRHATALDRIDVGSDADFTADAVRLAVSSGVGFHLVGRSGDVKGWIETHPTPHGRLHLAQARHAMEPERRVALARAIVGGKLWNQRVVMQRWRNNRNADDPADQVAIDRMNWLLKKVPCADDVGELMLLEAEAGKLMRQRLDAALEAFELPRRVRHPVPDPVNAALNWVAHLLARDMGVLVRRAGLHPGLAVLHACTDGRGSAVFDLVEEFRAPVCEALVLTLLNSGELGLHHFWKEPQGDKGYWMTPDGTRTILHRYEAWVTRQRLKPPEGEKGNWSWRGVFEHQVGRFKDHVLGEAAYEPYRMKA